MTYIKQLSFKLCKSNNIFSEGKHNFMFYFTLISVMDVCFEDLTRKSIANNINHLQKKWIRMVTFSHFNIHTITES